jgi:hypothetical protein
MIVHSGATEHFFLAYTQQTEAQIHWGIMGAYDISPWMNLSEILAMNI